MILFKDEEIDKRFTVRTSWVNDNAFCIRVTEYKRVKRFILKDKWEEVKVYNYASWENFMSIMWIDHMLSGKSVFEIDTKI